MLRAAVLVLIESSLGTRGNKLWSKCAHNRNRAKNVYHHIIIGILFNYTIPPFLEGWRVSRRPHPHLWLLLAIIPVPEAGIKFS